MVGDGWQHNQWWISFFFVLSTCTTDFHVANINCVLALFFLHPTKLPTPTLISHYETINWKILMHNLSLSGFKKIESEVRAPCRFNFEMGTARISFGDQYFAPSCVILLLSPYRSCENFFLLVFYVDVTKKKSFIFDYIIRHWMTIHIVSVASSSLSPWSVFLRHFLSLDNDVWSWQREFSTWGREGERNDVN